MERKWYASGCMGLPSAILVSLFVLIQKVTPDMHRDRRQIKTEICTAISVSSFDWLWFVGGFGI
jgi:hypothetical protein